MNEQHRIEEYPVNYGTKRAFVSLEDISGKKVTVMGLGLHGGGEASVRFLLRYGANVTVTDMKTQAELQKSVDSLMNDDSIDKNRLKFVLGKHEIEDFENADCVIKNPIVKYTGNKYLEKARYVESDISLFLQFTKSQIIAVTGSKGKSSTVSAIHYGLNEAGIKTLLGGNITVSPLTFFEQTLDENPPIVVLELSSWQLADLRGRKLLKPKVSVITKIVPDHQNWYGAMEPYVADKMLIFADQDKNDLFLCSHDTDGWGDTFAKECNATVVRYPTDFPEELKSGLGENKDWLERLNVPGAHNKENILNAAFVMSAMEVSANTIIPILQNYKGIGHRLEYFHTWNTNNCECKFYNDSAATVPEATVAAIQSFSSDLHLISGGTDKELDFLPLVTALESEKNRLKSIFLLAGTGTDKLIALLNSKNTDVQYSGPYNSLADLLFDLQLFLKKQCIANVQNIVFSPGATSFGMFKNEFDRGDTFKSQVMDIFR